MNCTIFENIWDKTNPHYITIDAALDRIRSGKSKVRVEEIRSAIDSEKRSLLKKSLPCVCFSGTFKTRFDENIINHSGFLVLDFDEVEDLGVMMAELSTKPFIYALWVSPSGNGIKALIRLADGKKHREHFAALKEMFPSVDKSGINESRVCYESSDQNIYINTNATRFVKIKEVEQIQSKEVVSDEREIFSKLLKWTANKGNSFAKGERNIFIFKLASACCRFGIQKENAEYLINAEFPSSNDFTHREASATIKSAYKSNASSSAVFEKDILIDKTSRKEIVIDQAVYDLNVQPKDVIYGAAVKSNALDIYMNGYEAVKGIGMPDIDAIFKAKRGEITCLTGIGNYGKSTWYKWNMLMRIIKYGEKFASFCPEDNPPEEYYHDFVEMLLGCRLDPENKDRYKPTIQTYSNAYDFVSQHIYYIYPKDSAPTTEYVKERFLEMIIKEKVDGCAIDPFNQMSHDYAKAGGRSDKYLELVLGDFSRFATNNNIYLTIIAHPKLMPKEANGNYACPDVFDISDGAMWNNKMDNILVYHRPFKQTDPSSVVCEIHSKKVRRQKVVGIPGVVQVEYYRKTRRYLLNGYDHMSHLLGERDLDFSNPIEKYDPNKIKNPHRMGQTAPTKDPKDLWQDELPNDYKPF